MNRLPGLLLLPVLAIALATTPMLRANVPLPSGLADPAGRTGFFTMVRGHVEAIDLTTGDTLWASDKAHRPLLVVGDRLYAFGKDGDKVRIVGLDLLAKGELVFHTEALPLPAWSA